VASLMAYMAKPKERERARRHRIHENRGQTEHIRDVVRRAANRGLRRVTSDLTARQGGGTSFGDAVTGAIGNLALKQKLDDHAAVPRVSEANTSGAIGAVGLLRRGEVWNLLAAGADLKAAAPYYGPQPSNYQGHRQQDKAATSRSMPSKTRGSRRRARRWEEQSESRCPYQISVFPA